jgi:hypothetical protein
MEQKIDDLTEKEQTWIDDQINGAAKLIEIMVPDAAGQPMKLAFLDQAFAAWLATGETDTQVINAVINQVGIAFGQFLVNGLSLRWVIATDNAGTDLAVHGLPGKGDVLIYPANHVAKRWERREANFLQNSYRETAAQLKALSDQGAQSKGFLKRLFGT